jgi:hypothetical protein
LEGFSAQRTLRISGNDDRVLYWRVIIMMALRLCLKSQVAGSFSMQISPCPPDLATWWLSGARLLRAIAARVPRICCCFKRAVARLFK